ncbi:MAG: alpha-ketoacid dehydrogenase subunit beta, partial [Candidatus Margulisbacteria bacterium]|nr:alpha-ketoacid dehydrogenase subunit beta [Candidatus Margulisiibacteriota bacterium]
HDAKGLLIAAVKDDNPVIYIEHRWLHNIYGEVPEVMFEVEIGKARQVTQGKDLTIVTSSYMTLECMKAAEILKKDNIAAEIIDLRTIKPLDETAILESIGKTGRLLVVDGAWQSFGVSAEVIALAAEKLHSQLKSAPARVAFPDAPTPTSRALANHYYPRAIDIYNAAAKILDLKPRTEEQLGIKHDVPLDVPDASFTGPF